MGYIPKVGDKIKLNPDAMLESLGDCRPSGEGTAKETTIESIEEHSYDNALIIVRLADWLFAGGYGFGVAVNRKNGAYWKAAEDIPNPPSLFLPVDHPQFMDVSELRRMNTDGREHCARCWGWIKKVRGLDSRYNHCPKCEP